MLDDLRKGIIETAQAIGANPLDLATVISYETAGTFDPTKRGPTTQWGQHRGLIQFGEPQAKQHGVDWNDPVGSQLGPDGAVASYFRSSGFKPGMGLLDLYSTVNAGAPGLYNRSDANNGGAPGTVADKVNNQMAGHRAKAEKLLGMTGEAAPTISTRGQTMEQGGLLGMIGQQEAPRADGILGMLFPKMSADRADKIRLGMLGSTLNPNQAAISGIQAGMAGRQRDAQMQKAQQAQAQQQAQEQAAEAQRRNRTAEWLASQGFTREAEAVLQGVMGAGDAFKMAVEGQKGPDFRQVTGQEAAALGLDPSRVYNVGADGKITGIGAGDTNINVDTGDKGPKVGTIPPGMQLFTDPQTGAMRMEPIPGGPVDMEQQQAQDKAGMKDDLSATAGDVVINSASRAREAAQERVVGGAIGNIAALNPSSQNAEVQRQVATLQSMAAAENINAMRQASPTGGALGNASDADILLLKQKSGALDPASPNFLRDLDDYERTLLRTIHGKDAGDAIFEQTRKGAKPASGGNQQGIPQSAPNYLNQQDAELWEYYTDQEKEIILRNYGDR